MNDLREGHPPVVLNRWPLIVKEWLGSDTLRGMSGDGEMLYLRLCLDQWERGAARASKEHWRKAHGKRCHDFDTAWSEAVEAFDPSGGSNGAGLVNERVARDRARSEHEILAKVNAAARTNAARAEKTLSARSASAERDAQRTLHPPSDSDSSSDSSSTEHRGKNQNPAAPPRARSARSPGKAVAVRSEVDERNAKNHTAMVDAWCKLFLASEGQPYVVTGADAKHVKEFVARIGPRFSLRDAWQRAGTLLATTEVFWITKRTLATLATSWNAIPSIPKAEAARAAVAWKSDYDRGLEAIMAAQRADEARAREQLNGHAEPKELHNALSGRTGLELDGPRGPQRSLPAAQVDAGHDAAPPRPHEDLFGGRGETRGSGPHRIGQGIGVILGAIPGSGDDRRPEARF